MNNILELYPINKLYILRLILSLMLLGVVNRYFVSFAEDQVSDMLNYLHIPFRRFTYICFRCGNIGKIVVERNKQDKILRIIHPSLCSRCGQVFGRQKFTFWQPDVLLTVGSNHAVISIEGPDHQKDRIMEKDIIQRELLSKLGIKVFVVEVENIEGFRKDLLDYLCDCYLATSDDDLYLKMCKKPKIGLLNHSTFENYLDGKLEKLS